MKLENREIAIEYLDQEIGSRGVSSLLKCVKKALKQEVATTHEFNIIALEIDPRTQTVTLTQDWYACQPETFLASEFIVLVETSRRRSRG